MRRYQRRNKQLQSLEVTLYLSVIGILLFTMVFAGTTLAWYSASETVAIQTIRSANYATKSIEITEIPLADLPLSISQPESPLPVEKNDKNTYSFQATADTPYRLTLTAEGSASQGHTLLRTVDGDFYITEKSCTFDLLLSQNGPVTIYSSWGPPPTGANIVHPDSTVGAGTIPTCTCEHQCFDETLLLMALGLELDLAMAPAPAEAPPMDADAESTEEEPCRICAISPTACQGEPPVCICEIHCDYALTDIEIAEDQPADERQALSAEPEPDSTDEPTDPKSILEELLEDCCLVCLLELDDCLGNVPACCCEWQCWEDQVQEDCLLCRYDSVLCAGNEPFCSCEYLCEDEAAHESTEETEENPCVLCSRDATLCEGTEPCQCFVKCSEAIADPDCPVCWKDPNLCEGTHELSCTCVEKCVEGSEVQCVVCEADRENCTAEYGCHCEIRCLPDQMKPDCPRCREVGDCFGPIKLCSCAYRCDDFWTSDCEACAFGHGYCIGEDPICDCDLYCGEEINDQCRICALEPLDCQGEVPEITWEIRWLDIYQLDENDRKIEETLVSHKPADKIRLQVRANTLYRVEYKIIGNAEDGYLQVNTCDGSYCTTAAEGVWDLLLSEDCQVELTAAYGHLNLTAWQMFEEGDTLGRGHRKQEQAPETQLPETDPETEYTPEADPETTPETDAETTPETQPETDAETMPETDAETTPESEPETETEAETQPAPETDPTVPDTNETESTEPESTEGSESLPETDTTDADTPETTPVTPDQPQEPESDPTEITTPEPEPEELPQEEASIPPPPADTEPEDGETEPKIPSL